MTQDSFNNQVSPSWDKTYLLMIRGNIEIIDIFILIQNGYAKCHCINLIIMV